MKKSPSAAGLALLFLLAAAAIAGMPFWLDSPGYRSNPSDPKSPWYRPTAPPTPPLPTATRTRTASPTPSISQTHTASPPATDTVSPTDSATPTDSPTPTETASPTESFTVSPTPTISPINYYDGDSPGAQFADFSRAGWTVTPGATYLLSMAETNSGGAASGLFHGRMTMRTLGYPILGGVGNTPGASVDLSSYNAISLKMRSVNGCFEPVVALHSPGSISTGTSVFVTATAYTSGSFDAAEWKTVVIPLSAFDGVNYWGNPYSLTANANIVDAVLVTPSFPRSFYWYAPLSFWIYRNVPPASYLQDTMDLDEVQFQARDAMPQRQLSAVFDGFISQDGWTQWGTQWSTYMDAYACLTPTTAFSVPTVAYPRPVDAVGGPFNSCYTGRIAGTLGAAAGASPCAGTEYAYAGMQAGFDAGGAPVSLTTLPELALTAGAVKGMRFWLKKGAGSAIDYDLILRKDSVAALNDGAHYRHLVTDAQLSSSAWQSFSIDFPATGLMGTDTVNSFGQPAWASGAGASVAWDTTDMLTLQIGPSDTARGMNFDIYVGKIEFY